MNGSIQEGLAWLSSLAFVNADGTTIKQGVGLTGFNSRLVHAWVTNTDTVDHVVNVTNAGSAANLLGSVNIPAGAGVGGVASVDLVASANIFNADPPAFPPGQNLGFALAVSAAAGKQVTITLIGAYLI